MNITYLVSSQAEENTSYNSWSTFWSLRDIIFQTENKEVFDSPKVTIQYIFATWMFYIQLLLFPSMVANTFCELSLDIFICSHT